MLEPEMLKNKAGQKETLIIIPIQMYLTNRY